MSIDPPTPPTPIPPSNPDPGDDSRNMRLIRLMIGEIEDQIAEVKDLDERHRLLRAMKLEIEKLARDKRISINVDVKIVNDPEPPPQGKRLTDKANAKMAKVADECRIKRSVRTFYPDGTPKKISETEYEIRGVLKATFDGLAGLAAMPVKIIVGLTVKVGKWIYVKVSGKGKSD